VIAEVVARDNMADSDEVRGSDNMTKKEIVVAALLALVFAIIAAPFGDPWLNHVD
jgi:hypothetical protein